MKLSTPEANATDEGLEWYDILNDLSMYTFQGNSFTFETEKLNLGSKKINNNIAKDKVRIIDNNL